MELCDVFYATLKLRQRLTRFLESMKNSSLQQNQQISLKYAPCLAY